MQGRIMRSVGLLTALTIAGSAAGAAVPRDTGVTAETCSAPFRVAQKSFKRLDARNAYVWVDDIESNYRRGYAPFQIAVVVGSAYPPFRAETGRLERAAFDRLVNAAYGVTRTNGTVSEAAVKNGVAVPFTSAKERFVLRVVSVNTSAGGEDALTLKLCR
jgi:hypothetical protein